MKNFLLFTTFLLLIYGCSQTAEYNKNLNIAGVNEALSINTPLQKAYIYVDSASLGSQSIASSTTLGREDDLDIDVGEFTQNESLRFFKNYLSNLESGGDKAVLASKDLLIVPEISSFGYGFYSTDGFDVDAKPFVSYTLNLKIFKNGKQIYAKNISANERNFGEMTFFGMGRSSYAQIGPIFQKAIANDYNLHASEIISAINLAK